MTQQIIVALIVALAAVYAVWRWMPARLAPRRRRPGLPRVRSARAWSTRSARSSWRLRWARPRAAASCDSCGSCCDRRKRQAGADADRR